MIADDYPDMVKAVSRVLAQDCDVVGTVADGSALLDAAERLQPDVILLDLSLPNANVTGGLPSDHANSSADTSHRIHGTKRSASH